jgi:hypothetical protein
LKIIYTSTVKNDLSFSSSLLQIENNIYVYSQNDVSFTSSLFVGGYTTLGGNTVVRPAVVVLATEAARNRIAPIAVETNEPPLTFFVSVTVTLAFAEGVSTGRMLVIANKLKVDFGCGDGHKKVECDNKELHRDGSKEIV